MDDAGYVLNLKDNILAYQIDYSLYNKFKEQENTKCVNLNSLQQKNIESSSNISERDLKKGINHLDLKLDSPQMHVNMNFKSQKITPQLCSLKIRKRSSLIVAPKKECVEDEHIKCILQNSVTEDTKKDHLKLLTNSEINLVYKTLKNKKTQTVSKVRAKSEIKSKKVFEGREIKVPLLNLNIDIQGDQNAEVLMNRHFVKSTNFFENVKVEQICDQDMKQKIRFQSIDIKK